MTTGPGQPGIVLDSRRSPHARLRPVPIGAVRVEGGFWGPWLERVRKVTLPEQHARLEETGRLDNFRRASGRRTGEFQGHFFNDSDVYKWVEAASYALAAGDAPGLTAPVDGVIDEIAAAQGPDGYLNTYFTFEHAAERYLDLVNLHELYCLGHLTQAGVAHRRATGKEALFDVALRAGALASSKRSGCGSSTRNWVAVTVCPPVSVVSSGPTGAAERGRRPVAHHVSALAVVSRCGFPGRTVPWATDPQATAAITSALSPILTTAHPVLAKEALTPTSMGPEYQDWRRVSVAEGICCANRDTRPTQAAKAVPTAASRP